LFPQVPAGTREYRGLSGETEARFSLWVKWVQEGMQQGSRLSRARGRPEFATSRPNEHSGEGKKPEWVGGG
jgi:hypothetical protein